MSSFDTALEFVEWGWPDSLPNNVDRDEFAMYVSRHRQEFDLPIIFTSPADLSDDEFSEMDRLLDAFLSTLNDDIAD